jgi:RNA binding exosome subunit
MLPSDSIVVPGHGAPTDVHTVDHSIVYLTELTKRVGEAISQGLSEQQAVERVTQSMKEYSANKIYPWVHAQVNVPKAYQELKAKR